MLLYFQSWACLVLVKSVIEAYIQQTYINKISYYWLTKSVPQLPFVKLIIILSLGRVGKSWLISVHWPSLVSANQSEGI